MIGYTASWHRWLSKNFCFFRSFFSILDLFCGFPYLYIWSHCIHYICIFPLSHYLTGVSIGQFSHPNCPNPIKSNRGVFTIISPSFHHHFPTTSRIFTPKSPYEDQAHHFSADPPLSPLAVCRWRPLRHPPPWWLQRRGAWPRAALRGIFGHFLCYSHHFPSI